MSDFVYLYGFVPPDAPAPAEFTGIAGREVRLLGSGEVHAVVSPVPADEYAPERIESRLQDLKWVAAQGAAHERVVAWFVDHGQILPVPLFTMYSSFQALQESIAPRSHDLRAELDRLRGQREWDVKVFFDEVAMQDSAARLSARVAELDREIASAGAGKGYLLQKKRSDLLKTEIRAAAHRRATEVINAMKPELADSRMLPIPRTEDVLPVVLHAALLVPVEHEKQVIAGLERHAAELKAIGMELSFSGPWAPYRFTGEQHD